MNMTLTFWLIAASLGIVSAGLVDPTQFYGYAAGERGDGHDFMNTALSFCKKDSPDGLTWR